MPSIINEKVWNRAKKAFVKSYDRVPTTNTDFKITMSIYKDMGGKTNKPITKSVAQKLFGNPRKMVKVK